jgi:hypothetical protein
MNYPNIFSAQNYHLIKPLIPRRIQLYLRRKVVQRKRSRFSNIWPIDEKASKPPEGWSGWPEGKRFGLVLTHDVETAKGQERCIQLAMLEERLGFRSSFNFVTEEYNVSAFLRDRLAERRFEIGVHGLFHKGNPFRSRKIFQEQAIKINHYLKDWQSVGYRSPCMYHNLEWIGELNIEYDSSTFDTDPFEPQPDGVGTIFPFWVPATCNPINPINPSNPSNPSNPLSDGFVELPYTLPQDHALFVIMREKSIAIWKKKLDWIAENGGMALLITHPDYMSFDGKKPAMEEYPVEYYKEFLKNIKSKYDGRFWHGLPKDISRLWRILNAEKVCNKG